jgi:phosphoserine phosphatase
VSGLVLVAFVIVVLIASARANELFRLSVREGRVLVVRGRIPVGLLADIRDVVAAPPVARATIRAVKESGGAGLIVSGAVDAIRAQRLRNVFGIRPIASLRTAPPIADPTLGQILGVAWLAWLLERR